MNTEIENQMIGAVLSFPKEYWSTQIDTQDFYSTDCRKAYDAIGQLSREGAEVNFLSVGERAKLDAQWLHNLTKSATHSSLAKSASRQIVDRNRRFTAEKAFKQALSKLEEGGDPSQVLAGAVSTIQAPTKGKIVSIGEAITSAIGQARDFSKRGAVIATGLPRLDNIMRLSGGKLFTIAGRPGTFKSAFALKILMRNSRNKLPTGLISLEMSPEETADRWLKMCGVKSDLHNGYGADAAEAALGEFSDTPFFMDCSTFDYHKVEGRIVEMVERHGVKTVIVDYLQLMKTTGKKQAYERIGDMTRGLKTLAGQLDIPIGILSQLNRMSEIENRPPKLSDLRESGNIEQDSDIVIFIHHFKDKETKKDVYILYLAKQRGGKTGKIGLHIDPEIYRIGELAG